MSATVQADWIDREFADRRAGRTRPLLYSEHEAVNARYPGCTLEYCVECGQPTGRAGRHDDSLYVDDDGPYCAECFEGFGEGAQ